MEIIAGIGVVFLVVAASVALGRDFRKTRSLKARFRAATPEERAVLEARMDGDPELEAHMRPLTMPQTAKLVSGAFVLLLLFGLLTSLVLKALG